MNVIIDKKGETYESKLISNVNESKESEDLGGAKKNKEIDNWFKPKIDKKILKELYKRKSLPGIFSITMYFFSLLLTGFLA